MRMTCATPCRSTFIWALIAGGLATGWAVRERAHAQQQAETIASRTINLDEIKMSAYTDKGVEVGDAGLYLQGDTPLSNLTTGRFIIRPKSSPHAPHVHDEEEIMIIESGHGEIFCDGKTTKVGPGSVMYTAPRAPHGIVNTEDEPLVFYFMKWLPRAGANGSAR